MATHSRKRDESKFMVIDHFVELRHECTALTRRSFGVTVARIDDQISRKFFKNIKFEELKDDDQKARFNVYRAQAHHAYQWLIPKQRDTIEDELRKIHSCLTIANSIYPTTPEELIERRNYQNEAIGRLQSVLAELQYTARVLYSNLNKYAVVISRITYEIELIKKWRRSDNTTFAKIKKLVGNRWQINKEGLAELIAQIIIKSKQQ